MAISLFELIKTATRLRKLDSLQRLQDLRLHRDFVTGHYPNALQTVTHKAGEGWRVAIVDIHLALDARGRIDTRGAGSPQLLSGVFHYSSESFDTAHAPAAWADAANKLSKLLA